MISKYSFSICSPVLSKRNNFATCIITYYLPTLNNITETLPILQSMNLDSSRIAEILSGWYSFASGEIASMKHPTKKVIASSVKVQIKDGAVFPDELPMDVYIKDEMETTSKEEMMQKI